MQAPAQAPVQKCAQITAAGTPCTRNALPGQQFCAQHLKMAQGQPGSPGGRGRTGGGGAAGGQGAAGGRGGRGGGGRKRRGGGRVGTGRGALRGLSVAQLTGLAQTQGRIQPGQKLKKEELITALAGPAQGRVAGAGVSPRKPASPGTKSYYRQQGKANLLAQAVQRGLVAQGQDVKVPQLVELLLAADRQQGGAQGVQQGGAQGGQQGAQGGQQGGAGRSPRGVNYNKMRVAELQGLAAQRGLNVQGLRKPELIAALKGGLQQGGLQQGGQLPMVPSPRAQAARPLSPRPQATAIPRVPSPRQATVLPQLGGLQQLGGPQQLTGLPRVASPRQAPMGAPTGYPPMGQLAALPTLAPITRRA